MNSTVYRKQLAAGLGIERATAFGCNGECSAKQQICDRSVAITTHTSSRHSLSNVD